MQTCLLAGALGFRDLIDVERLLLEDSQLKQAACSIEGFGSYGAPVYTMVQVPDDPPVMGSYGAAAVGAYGGVPASSSSNSSESHPAAASNTSSSTSPAAAAAATANAANSTASSNASSSAVQPGASSSLNPVVDAPAKLFLQEKAVKRLSGCTPLLTSGRLLGVGGLANCTVSQLFATRKQSTADVMCVSSLPNSFSEGGLTESAASNATLLCSVRYSAC